MEKITIAIIDNDINYKNALVEFMKAYCQNYIIHLPSEDEFMSMEKVHSMDISTMIESNDIILINYNHLESIKEVIGDNIMEFINKSIIILEGFNTYDETKTRDFNIISKYTDIKKLINYIDNHYYQINSKKISLGNSLTKLIVCLSLSGGSGTSSISTGICNELAKHHEQRVFYLSSDLFETDIIEKNKASHDSVLYSLIKNDFSNERKIIENNIMETGDCVWRMPPSKYKNVFSELALKKKAICKKHYGW